MWWTESNDDPLANGELANRTNRYEMANRYVVTKYSESTGIHGLASFTNIY